MDREIIETMLDCLERAMREAGAERALRVEAEQRLAAEVARKVVRVEDVHDLMCAMATNRIIDAIKLHRQMTGYGLKESKDAVEAIMRRETLNAA